MPIPLARWREIFDDEVLDEEEESRGPRYFDPSLDLREAWRPPRPPRGEETRRSESGTD
jgi:hypothetical protein